MCRGKVSITHNYFSRRTATVKVTYVPVGHCTGHLLGRTPDDDTLAVAVSLPDTTRLVTAPARVFCGTCDHYQPLTHDGAFYAL